MTPRKFCLIYRDNDLFATYIDALLAEYEIVGTYIIPRGEMFEDHKDGALQTVENAGAAGAEVLVCDSTCNGVFSRKNFRGCVNLNYVFADQIRKRHPTNTVEANFALYARKVIHDRPLKKVIVVADSITDHDFAGSNEAESPSGSQSETRILAWMEDQLQAIFPNVAIQTIETLKEALNQADDPETLLIVDRHAGLKEVMSQSEGWYDSAHNWPHQCMLYTLPFATCASQLASLGYLEDFDLASLRKSFQEELPK